MRVQITNNGSDTITLRESTIAGFRIFVEATGELTFDAKSCFLTATLSRAGGSETILSGQLLPLAKANNPGNAENQSATADGYTGIAYVVEFNNAVINLRGDDSITATLSVAGAVNATTTFSEITGQGAEAYVPNIQVVPINKNNSSLPVDMGGNVSKCALIQDGNGWSVTGVTGRHSLGGFDYIKPELAAMALEQRPGVTSTAITDRVSCVFYNGWTADRFQLTLTVDTAETSSAWLVWYGGRSRDMAGAADFVATQEKIIARNQAKFGAFPLGRLDTTSAKKD